MANFSAGTNEDTKVGGQLSGSDANGDALSFHAVAAVPGLTVNASGTWSFDPAGKFDSLAAGQQTAVTFKYQANDGTGDGNIATATITIAGVNDAPVHQTNVHLIQVGEDEKGSTVNLGLFGSTTDPDSANFTFVLDGKAPVGVTLDSKGFLHLDPAGHYEALAKGDVFTSSVSFRVSDGAAVSNVQTFTLQVLGANETTLAARDVIHAEGMLSQHFADGGATMGGTAVFVPAGGHTGDVLVPMVDAI